MKWIAYAVFLCSVFDVFTINYANSVGKDAMGNKLIIFLLLLINTYTVLAILLIEKNNLKARYQTFVVLLLTIPIVFLFMHTLAIIVNIIAFSMSFLG
jgi:hypothetical protein